MPRISLALFALFFSHVATATLLHHKTKITQRYASPALTNIGERGLKCKAYLELVKAKSSGQPVDSKKIRKHKNDVFRLIGALNSADTSYTLPKTIYNDVSAFCESVKTDLPNSNLIKKDMRLRRITPHDLLERLTTLFTLEK